ncbi:MAG: acetate--CoA ligase [Pseudomonadota bacterium]|nr:acetate--CoA ligase [Pseudomonadota bacterium]
MSEKIYPVSPEFAGRAFINQASYQQQYQRSVAEPEAFWAEQAERFVDWSAPWDRVLEWDYRSGLIRWFQGAQLNVTHNCLDRHLASKGEKTAILWEGDEPGLERRISYRELHEMVCRLANGLKQRGVRKGDRVCIYMPMIPEAAVAMLACARIGAIHSVVFGGFSPAALRDRILDADCRTVITADEGVRGGRTIPLKSNVDTALEQCPNVHDVVVVRRTGGKIAWSESRDVWYEELTSDATADCPAEPMDAEDPLFILYTSGSTGKPKGVLHTSGGYLLHAAMTHRYVLDCHDDDIYWCSADVGWITGHSYIVYGPLCNGTTTVMFEGVPTYPNVSRFWEMIDRHGVTIFYTAPTAIRALMAHGSDPLQSTQRSSLRLLGTVGEPINPEAWEWYHREVGLGRCPVVDTWWQTETGGILIAPLPGATDLKPGSATHPFFGVQPALLDNEGKEIEGAGEGNLVLKFPWPGQMRTVYGDHQRFIDTYFSAFPGYYFTGDGARRDADGYYWITGRVDDVLNVSGHRLGTAEIESALVLHPNVAEAAVVGRPHEVKGQGVYAYVTLMKGIEPSESLRKELMNLVAKELSPIAKPDEIHWAPGLPKTRSGKIMRRILRKIAADELDQLGDTSTLADPTVVDNLIAGRHE